MVSNLHGVTQHIRSGIGIPATAVLFRRLSLKAVLWGRERKKDMPCHRREDAKGTQKATSKHGHCKTQTRTLKASSRHGPHPRQEDAEWEPIGTESGPGRINSTPHILLPV